MRKKTIIFIVAIMILAIFIVIGLVIKNKLEEERINNTATYQLDTSSAWSIMHNKNANFKVELLQGNVLKVEAIGSSGTSMKITCSNEKNEEIVLKATYTKEDGVKIIPEGENTNLNVDIKIGDKTFEAVFYNNSATQSLIEKLPLSLIMNDKNGNEKYCYLDSSLPTTSVKMDKVNAGEIMLYTSNCLVLFYDTFNTDYEYTKIGYIQDISELKETLRNNSVQIEIMKRE